MITFGDVDPRHANNHIYKNDYVLTQQIIYKFSLSLQGIMVFAAVMATLGLQVLLESGREFISKVCNFVLWPIYVKDI